MNLNVKKLLIRFFEKYYSHQHPETALRYLPVISEITKANLLDSKILEIGSGSLGITPYLRKEIEGIDIDFSGPQTKLIKKNKGNADNLPFKKNTYDVTISVDVIEHLAKERREMTIYEQLRVTSKLAVIVVPTGEYSQEQDKILHDYYIKIFSDKNQFLDEHIKFGLPSTDEILVWIDKSTRKLKKKPNIKSYPLLNLFVRNILMRTWISRSELIYYLYMKGYLLLVPFLRLANFGNCYRRIFVIEFSS